MRRTETAAPPSAWTCLAVFLLAALAYGLHGFQGALAHDDALHAYAGQQLARGVPPYTSVFLQKGPVSPFLAASGALTARLVDADELLGIRSVFFIVSCLTVVALYLFATDLFRSRRIGILSALVFIGFWGFGSHAASGPRPKTPIVIFETLLLLFTAQRKWYSAGFFGSLAFLTWQPMLAYPAMTILLATLQSKRGARLRNARRSLLGFLSPLLCFITYYAATGHLADFFGSFILQHITSFEREYSTLMSHIVSPVIAIHNGYSIATLSILLGFWAFCIMFLWRLRQAGGLLHLAQEDRFAGFFFSLAAPVAWSLRDFQDYPDCFVFLPYAAVAFAWFLETALVSLGELLGLTKSAERLLFYALSGILFASAALNYQQTSTVDLIRQRRHAADFGKLAGDDFQAVILGAPEILVLLNERSFTRYLDINGGADSWIEHHEPGGFSGWATRLKESNPRAVAISWWRFNALTPLGGQGESVRADLGTWLKASYQEAPSWPGWSVWVRADIAER